MRARDGVMDDGVRNDDIVSADFVNGTSYRVKFGHNGTRQVMYVMFICI